MSSVLLQIDPSPKFSFIVVPPPKKKRAAVNNIFRAPASPVNPSRAILTWASNVQPGSPAPMTPTSGVSLPRRASFVSSPLLQAFRRSSLSRANSCCQSVSSVRSRTPSASFFQLVDPRRTPTNSIPVPTPSSPSDVKVDLTLFGYASSFVHLPAPTPPPTTPAPSNVPRMLKRLLGTKSNLTSQAHTKRTPDHLHPGVFNSLPGFVEKYPTSTGNSSRPAEVQPLRLKQEGRMRQAIGGRSLGSNIKIMEVKAERKLTVIKANAIDGAEVAGEIETVHRDELCGIWWDQQEESESAHLLPPTEVPLSAQYPDAEGWVTYNHLKEFERESPSQLSSQPSSKHTDLYHSRPLLVTNEDPEQRVRGRATRCASIAGSIVLPSPSIEPSNILLAVPSRPKRGRHLKPGFLKDVIAVPPTPTPPSPYSQASCPPRSPARTARFILNTSAKPYGSMKRQRSRSRSLSRRKRKPVPPPLKIVPICPVNKVAVNVDPGEEDRKMEDSFKSGPQFVTSRWSRETMTPGPSPARLGKFDSQTNGFASADAPKKSRRLGRFFNKGEREFWTR